MSENKMNHNRPNEHLNRVQMASDGEMDKKYTKDYVMSVIHLQFGLRERVIIASEGGRRIVEKSILAIQRLFTLEHIPEPMLLMMSNSVR